MKVLFVQKVPMLAAALTLTLLKQGYEVVFCKEASEVVTMIKDIQPQLIIADITFSKNGGQLISIAKHKRIPVIVLSEMANENVLQQAFDLGADDYASLPVSLTELSLRINKVTRFRA